MKQLLPFCLGLILSVSASAQAPRLVLLEEFTGETCGPCAVNNPGMNAIIDANPTKVISLKYQNNIPSAGPNFFAYNTVDVANRTTYYANNYSPHAFIDGNYWDDNAGAVTAALIDTRAAVTSPFTIAVEHSFSPNRDSIYTTTTVTAVSNVTNTELNLRIAVSERNIYGYTSPNGEQEFSHVMRKLLPSGTGLPLQDAWTAGQSATFSEAWAIKVPTGTVIKLPIWAMLEVISWVQDDATKEIIQAGHSPAKVTADAGIVGFSGTAISCATDLAPSITVENLEPTTITSMDFEYTLDAGTPVTYAWTGSLIQGGTAQIVMPGTPFAPGPHSLNVRIVNINGSADVIPTNNVRVVGLGSPFVAPAIAEAFATATWPPVNWLNINEDGAAGWTRNATAGFNGAGSAKMDYYNSSIGNIDYLYPIQALNLTGVTNAVLKFDLSHRRYDANYSDRMEIQSSIDCGATWASLWNKAGDALATVSTPSTAAFTPTLAAQWRAETVDLAGLAGNPLVIFRVKATSGFGNNAYIDNVNTSTTSSLDDVIANSDLNVYPNPANQSLTLDFATVASADVQMTISNTIGQIVHTATPYNLTQGAHKINIPVGQLASGMYFITLHTNEGVLTKSFTVSR
jgi:Secretion system C-terminal sorting domain